MEGALRALTRRLGSDNYYDKMLLARASDRSLKNVRSSIGAGEVRETCAATTSSRT